MFRRWLSAFWRNNKEKIMQIAKIFGIMIGIGMSAGIIFSTLDLGSKEENNTISKIYVPEKTVISGSNISEEEYEKENNLAQTFVDYCNEQKVEEAYNLLTSDCKEKNYPTVKAFKEKYYNMVFQEDRIYTLQSWVNRGSYNTYKISYTGDFMSTGNYDEMEKYEDYITVVTDEKGNKKININNYVKTEAINKITKTNNLEIEALNCDTYINYVIYTFSINNTTDKDILLDNLSNYAGIKLIGTNGASYKIDSTNLKRMDLEIGAGKQNYITLKFKKQYGSEVTGNSIQFENVILDYVEYTKNTKNYENFSSITINL